MTSTADSAEPPASSPQRVLVVTAHPDDVDFGSAGTVATMTAAGIEVTYCIITDGAAGAADPDVVLEDLPHRRQAEQRKAAAEVGVSQVMFLGYPDGRLEVSYELRRDLSRVIRQTRPDRVVCQSPERNWDRIRASHPDHLAAGEATLQAVYPDSRNPYAHPELLASGFQPHEVGEVWLMASPRADHFVDITSVIERKLAALRCHESQVGEPEQLEEFVRRWTAATALQAGFGEGRHAEAFQVVNTR
ncbi:MAG: PIG-L deacetylase family protein [Acidimicrobiales bacterium]|jgi:LmbE family N-acetylglucosaminyl deacetylase